MLIHKSRGAVVATAFYGAVESAKLHAALVILLSVKDKESRERDGGNQNHVGANVFASNLQSILP